MDNLLAQNLNFDKIQAIGAPKFIFWGGRNGDLGSVISAILPYIFGAAGIALLIYMIFGGFQLMMSRGDPKAMQSAQGKITNALIGFVIIIVAFLLVQLLGQLFGLKTNTAFQQIFGIK